MRFLRKATSTIVHIGPFVDISDGVTGESAVALTTADRAELLKANTSTVVDISLATWASIISANNHYALTLTSAHTDTGGPLRVIVEDESVALAVYSDFHVIAADVYDALYGNSAAAFNASQEVAGLAPSSIVADVFAADAITATAIAASAITSVKIAASAITAVQIGANAIGATQIAASAITSIKIAAAAITATQLGASAITSIKIAANAITATQVATDTITAAKIAASAITSVKIAADAITATQIAASTITSIKVAADAITSAQVSSDILNRLPTSAVVNKLNRTVNAEVLGTCASAGTISSIVLSSLDPASSVNDQFNGRVFMFAGDTTTAALRGQGGIINDFDHSAQTILISANLTTAPAVGDTLVIT